MSWERLARFVQRRPGRVLAGSLALLVAPTFALPSTRVSYDVLAELPKSEDSVRGFDVLSRSFAPGQVQPLVLVLESSGPMWNDGDFRAIDELTLNLAKVPNVTSVRSLTRPTGGAITPEQIQAAGLGDLVKLPEQMQKGAEGLARAIDGLRQIRGGLEQIRARAPAFEAGIDQALAGIGALRDGVGAIHDGLGDARAALSKLATEIADPAQDNLQHAWDDLKASTVAKSDPVYQDLAQRVGTALALVSGRCPDATGVAPPLTPNDQPCQPGQPIEAGYDGLSASLRQVASGLGQAQDGLDQVDAGLGRLADGLGSARPGIAELRDGAGRMIAGLDLIIPGLGRLHRGLVVGFAQARAAGLIPDPSEGGDVALTAALVEAFPKLKDQLAFFVSPDAHATRLFVTLDRPPYEAASLDASKEIQDVTALSLRRTSLERARVSMSGSSAFFSDVRDIEQRDFRLIIWAVILGIFLVLALLLRSIVAPAYLVATVLLSFGATMGIATVVFQGFFHEAGLVWWLPPFLFVMLVALGADYNIFLTSRIREEAETSDTREAVARGLALTGGVITSAGLILAGTFAALMAAPLRGMVEMGFATTVGILIDTFVVRSLMVPSIATLVGRYNWWPSKRAQRA